MSTKYRSEHVGSLLRPPELLAARTRAEEGKLSEDELRAIEDRAILDILAMQRSAGIDVVTDGEYRRAGWFAGFVAAANGFEQHTVTRKRRTPEGLVEIQSVHPMIAGKLSAKRRITGNESAYLLQHAKLPFKITLPSAIVFMMTSWLPEVSEKAYASRAEAARDLTRILRDEISALFDENVPYVQIDAPQYMQINDPAHHNRLEGAGWPPAQAFEDAIAADSATLEGMRRPDRTLALHLCRGNVRGMWIAEGGYDAIAERLFNTLDVDRFVLEYDSDRAGSFEPLRFVPKGTDVTLGLVTTKTPELESADELLRRIEEASRYIDVERLALSPQCGFATQAAGNPISFDDQRRKLELIAGVAQRVWHDAG
jgi:5-methyltetrahydropteroyltriglutamate--homocysteine methyltransferase